MQNIQAHWLIPRTLDFVEMTGFWFSLIWSPDKRPSEVPLSLHTLCQPKTKHIYIWCSGDATWFRKVNFTQFGHHAHSRTLEVRRWSAVMMSFSYRRGSSDLGTPSFTTNTWCSKRQEETKREEKNVPTKPWGAVDHLKGSIWNPLRN